jgi:Glycosyltransferase like family
VGTGLEGDDGRLIAFGCPITDPAAYKRYAEPGISLAAEPDSETFTYLSPDSIFRAYNYFCDEAAEFEDLEALVLIHQDAEIADPGFSGKVRAALADAEVAIAGCTGAVDVRSIAYWEGSVTWASHTHRFEEFGGSELPGISWPDEVPSYTRTGEVDSIDGVLIVMSPWAIRNLRFDESLGNLHGYDLDICLQARAAGRKVVTADLRVIHHHPLELLGDPDGWISAHMKVAEKWSDLLDRDAPEDWRQRARRAEAELAATRVQLRMSQTHITRLAGDFEALQASKSWRITGPLRALWRLIRRVRHPGKSPGRELGEGLVRSDEGAPPSVPSGERPTAES